MRGAVVVVLAAVVLVGCGGSESLTVRPVGGSAVSSSVPVTSLPAVTSSTLVVASTTSAGRVSTSVVSGSSTTLGTVPTSSPSAVRRGDGKVVSTTGYVARTPAVANGMLLEGAWSADQQAAVDVVHRYVDAWYLAQSVDHPTGEPSAEMLALENPTDGLTSSADPPLFPFHKRLEVQTNKAERLTWPELTPSVFKVTRVEVLKSTMVFVSGCERNTAVGVDEETGHTVDSGTLIGHFQIVMSRPPDSKVMAALISPTETCGV